MLAPRLLTKNFPPLIVSILDDMSDGQWHPTNKLLKRFPTANKGNDIKESLELLVSYGYLTPGANSSYRMQEKHVRSWRTHRGLHMDARDSRSPRFFGGMLEDDGWSKAPLRDCDLLHFRAESHVTASTIQAWLGARGRATQDEDGLLRIATQQGSAIYRDLKQWSLDEPALYIKGVRLNPNAKRRNLDELPPGFINDMCIFYGSFAHILLRNSMSSIKKHISEEDDIQQQIYLWILDAAARYDEKTCIPFAAYLSAVSQKWVHNLNRKAHGRSAADNELKHSRAIATFLGQNGRAPSIKELSEILGEDVAKVTQDSMSIRTVGNLRNMTTLDSEDFTIPLVAEENFSGKVEKDTERTLLSAALVSTALEQSVEDSTSLNALFSIIDKTWSRGKPLSALYTLVTPSELAESEKSLMESVGVKLRTAYNA